MFQDSVPYLPVQRVIAADAEIVADIRDDRADGAAADLGGDFLFGGHAGEQGTGGVGGREFFGSLGRPRARRGGSLSTLLGTRRRRAGLVDPGGVLRDALLERGGAHQAAGDARDNQRDVERAEPAGEIEQAIGSAGLL